MYSLEYSIHEHTWYQHFHRVAMLLDGTKINNEIAFITQDIKTFRYQCSHRRISEFFICHQPNGKAMHSFAQEKVFSSVCKWKQ